METLVEASVQFLENKDVLFTVQVGFVPFPEQVSEIAVETSHGLTQRVPVKELKVLPLTVLITTQRPHGMGKNSSLVKLWLYP